MRIGESSRLLPEGILLGEAARADIHDRLGLVQALTSLKDRDQHLTECELAGMELGLLPGLRGIEQCDRLILGVDLILKADQIRLDLAGLLLIDAVDLLVAGVRDLLRVLGELDLGLEGAIVSPDCGELVDAAERRAVLGRDEVVYDRARRCSRGCPDGL